MGSSMSHYRTTEERERDLAEHKDCLPSQLYNVTPIMKKLSTLQAKTNSYNTTNR